ncbi:MAG: hypothetical protein IPN42_15695 [Methylococcaceae bacterium]|nr:hypothetical protein [Methylococcaceae bacterium]
MEPLSTWENLLLGALAIIVVFWMKPGIKAALERSKTAQADWPGVLVPLVLVVVFVFILIAMVKA